MGKMVALVRSRIAGVWGRILAAVSAGAAIIAWVTFGTNALDWFSEAEHDEIVVGFSLEEIRDRNQVREMLAREQGLELSALSGIYGFVGPLEVHRLFAPSWLFPSPSNPRPRVERKRFGGEVEIHKTTEGKIMAIVYLSEGDVERLYGAHRGSVEVLAFFEEAEEHRTLVGLPKSRVEGWDYQNLEFAPVLVGQSAGGAGVTKQQTVSVKEPAGGEVLAETEGVFAEDSVDIQWAERERVLLGDSVADLRTSNRVRALMYEEQSVDLSRLSGIWGVTKAEFFEKNLRRGRELLHNITLQNEPQRYSAVVEVHKAVDGKVSVVGFVKEGTVGRLVDAIKPVGRVYFYHEPDRDGLALVAIPASRIVGWDYRSPHEFSEIVVDRNGR